MDPTWKFAATPFLKFAEEWGYAYLIRVTEKFKELSKPWLPSHKIHTWYYFSIEPTPLDNRYTPQSCWWEENRPSHPHWHSKRWPQSCLTSNMQLRKTESTYTSTSLKLDSGAIESSHGTSTSKFVSKWQSLATRQEPPSSGVHESAEPRPHIVTTEKPLLKWNDIFFQIRKRRSKKCQSPPWVKPSRNNPQSVNMPPSDVKICTTE